MRNVHRMASDDLHHHAMHEDVLMIKFLLGTDERRPPWHARPVARKPNKLRVLVSTVYSRMGMPWSRKNCTLPRWAFPSPIYMGSGHQSVIVCPHTRRVGRRLMDYHAC